MKNILLGLFTITSLMGLAQAKLGMRFNHSFSPSDSVLVNTTVNLTATVENKGNIPFLGTFTLNVALNNGTITPIAAVVSTTSLSPNDSIQVITTFTAQAGANGWKVAGNGNVIVVWPISSGIETVDSLNTILTVYEPQGIHDFEKELFTIYPNPTKELLQIKQTMPFVFESYTIYDITAREIESNAFAEQITIRQLPKGIYWLVLSNGDKRYKQKFIKE